MTDAKQIFELKEQEEDIKNHYEEFKHMLEISSSELSVEDIFRHGYMFGFMDARFNSVRLLMEQSSKDSLDERITL